MSREIDKALGRPVGRPVFGPPELNSQYIYINTERVVCQPNPSL